MSSTLARHLLSLLAGVIVVVQLYVLGAYAWSGYGGTSWSLFRLELPAIFMLALVLYAPKAGRIHPWAWVHAVLPVLVFYVVYDVYHHLFSRSLRVSDLQEFAHLSELEPRIFALVIALVAALLALTAWRHARWLRALTWRQVTAILAGKAVILLALLLLLVSPWLQAALLHSSSFVAFDDWKNIKYNGRITGVLFYQARQNEARAKLLGSPHPSVFESLYLAPVAERRNVHVIVLESFIDPRKLSGVEWTPSPLCPRLKPFLGTGDFSLVRSPVYGGFTAQAEFEILTGLPALRLVNGIEFNSMEGHPTSTWVGKLQQGGYHTVATYATHSGFYNTRRAYPSLGFGELHGLDNVPYFAMPKGERILADSLLYQANLKFIHGDLMQRQPFVNYVLTMQGHYPYTRDPAREPTVIQPRSAGGVRQELTDVANLFYHRTCALADFLVELKQTDPQAIVLAVSDHLPPDIIEHEVGYPAGQFMNVALLLDRFEPVDLSQKKYYEIAHELWRRLGARPKEPAPVLSAAQLEALYLSLHAESITAMADRPAGAAPALPARGAHPPARESVCADCPQQRAAAD